MDGLKRANLNIGFVVVVAAVAGLGQGLGMLAFVDGISDGGLDSSLKDGRPQVAAFGECFTVGPFLSCLPWNCVCVTWPSCTC